MADVPVHGRPVGFHSLPPEIRYHIFGYIYPPWHFEYTQVHDLYLTPDQASITEYFHRTATGFTSTPRFSNLPSLAPLLACKDFHDAGRHIFESSFTGHMHVISGMIWKEVHRTYACIMAKSTTLTVDVELLRNLYLCGILDRLPNLENVTVTTTFENLREFFRLSCRYENYEAEQTRAPDQLSLEGSEHIKFLPADVDLSDTALLRFWTETDNQPYDLRTGVDFRIREILCSMDVKIVCRVVIQVYVLPEYADQGISIYIALDFENESWHSDITKRSSESTNSYVLVRKRLAMIRAKAS